MLITDEPLGITTEKETEVSEISESIGINTELEVSETSAKLFFDKPFYYLKDGKAIFNVNGIEYDISDLTEKEVAIFIIFRGLYLNNRTLNSTYSFEEYIYMKSEIRAFNRVFDLKTESIQTGLGVDFESPTFQTEYQFKEWFRNLKVYWNNFKWIGLPLIVIISIIFIALIIYVYIKSYVSTKAIKKAGV